MQTPPELVPVLQAFNLPEITEVLPGGSTPNYRAGDAVLKRIRETSLENDHSPELAQWIAGFSARLPREGFRLPQPLPTQEGKWMAKNGWMASNFLPGRHAEVADIPDCISGIAALHAAIRDIPRHPLMDGNSTAWGKAHRWCWGEKPEGIQPELCPLVDELYALRKPIQTSPWQLMHADINPENVLIEPGLPPAFLDFSPFWGPPEFATAIFANFIGPRRRDGSVLRYFENVPAFDQLLVRAAIRMLLVVSALDGLGGWKDSEEKWAAEYVIQYLAGRVGI